MARLKNYADFTTQNESYALDQLGIGHTVSYTKNNGKNAKGEIHRIDHTSRKVYFLDSNGKEFGKDIDQIVSAND